MQTDGPGQIAYSKSVRCQTKEVDRFSRTFINMVDGQSKFKVYKQKDSTCQTNVQEDENIQLHKQIR